MSCQLPWDQHIHAGTAQKVLGASNIHPDMELTDFRVLDFGCGNGRYLEVFASCLSKNNLCGTEVSIDRVTQVKKKGFTCVQLDPKRSYLPFVDESFNVVFSSNVIEHIPRKLYFGYLAEIHRVLKTGGRFVVGTANYPIKRLYDIKKAFTTKFTRYYLFDDPTHCNKMSIFSLERDLRTLFKEIHLEPTYILFEEKIPWLKRPKVQHMLRGFSDKIFGYCVK